jgi:ribosomal-protein-alanine N-acetyltransferase
LGIARAAELAIRPLETREEAEACARMMAGTEPWITLRRDYETCLRVVLDETRERYVAYRGDRLAGLLILNVTGAFVGYIQTVCAAEEFRGTGVGTALVAFAEQRIFRDFRNAFICVSDFNHGARRLYERLGFRLVGELTDYVVAGHSELLLRKSMGPLGTDRS